MKHSQAVLDEMVDKAAWKRPAQDALTADQLDRFLQVRQRIDHAVRASDGRLDALPRKHVRSLEELWQVPDVIQGVSDVVGAEMDAFVAAGMTPAEYHWLERLVYERWRGALRRAGTYPTALRAAARRGATAAAAREKRAAVRARLERAGRGDEVAHPGATRGPEPGHPRAAAGAPGRHRALLDGRHRASDDPDASLGRGPSDRPEQPHRRPLAEQAEGRVGARRAAPRPRRASARASARPTGAPATRSSSSANAASLCSRSITG